MAATVVHGGLLTVLGCDGSYPGPGGAASGYLVQGDGVTLWVDAGAGTFANLQLVSDPAAVDAVILSHEHPDHWSDIDSFATWLHDAHSAAPVPVYAPPGLRGRAYCADDPVLRWCEVEPSCRLTMLAPSGEGGLGCVFSVTDHGPPTLAMRIDLLSRAAAPPGALVYSADTGPPGCDRQGVRVVSRYCPPRPRHAPPRPERAGAAATVDDAAHPARATDTRGSQP